MHETEFRRQDRRHHRHRVLRFLCALVPLWLKNPFNQRNPRLKKYSSCRVLCPLHLSRTLYKSTLFMQNKANLLDAQMNVTSFITKYYENKWQRRVRKNKPSSNPIYKILSRANSLSCYWRCYDGYCRGPNP